LQGQRGWGRIGKKCWRDDVEDGLSSSDIWKRAPQKSTFSTRPSVSASPRVDETRGNDWGNREGGKKDRNWTIQNPTLNYGVIADLSHVELKISEGKTSGGIARDGKTGVTGGQGRGGGDGAGSRREDLIEET